MGASPMQPMKKKRLSFRARDQAEGGPQTPHLHTGAKAVLPREDKAVLPREDTLFSDNSPKPISKDSSSCGDLSIPEVDVLWIGNVYKYTDPKLSVLTVLLRHIRCRSTAYPSTVQVFDAFIKQTEIDIVVPTSLRMFCIRP